MKQVWFPVEGLRVRDVDAVRGLRDPHHGGTQP